MSVELLDVMNYILDAINGLPYRIRGFMKDDNLHKECPSCGKHVSRLQGARFCPYCGDQVFSAEEVNVNLKVCLGCEMNPEGDSLFNFYFSHCPWCGKELIVLPDNIYVHVMTMIYEHLDGLSSLEDGLSLYEIPSKDLVERIEGLKNKRHYDDPFDLTRFMDAQEGIYEQVLSELRLGEKRSHWMWYIFPQIDGLGHSKIARRYAIESIEEAREYLNHPVLGVRLLECAETVLGIEGRSVSDIFRYPDDMKLGSSMTLFAYISESDSVFALVLDKFFNGHRDNKTLELLETN